MHHLVTRSPLCPVPVVPDEKQYDNGCYNGSDANDDDGIASFGKSTHDISPLFVPLPLPYLLGGGIS